MCASLGLYSVQAVAENHDNDLECSIDHPDRVVKNPYTHFSKNYDIKGKPKHVIDERHYRDNSSGTDHYYYNKDGGLTKFLQDDGSLWEYEFDKLGRVVKMNYSQKPRLKNNKLGPVTKLFSTTNFTYIDEKNMVIIKEYGYPSKKWIQTIATVRDNDSNGDRTCYLVKASYGGNNLAGYKYVLLDDRKTYFQLVTNGDYYKEHLYDSEKSADSALYAKLEDLRRVPLGRHQSGCLYYEQKEKDGDEDKFTNRNCMTDVSTSVEWQNDHKVTEIIYDFSDKNKLPDGQVMHEIHKYSMFDDKGNWGRSDTYVNTPATLTEKAGIKPNGDYQIQKITYWE